MIARELGKQNNKAA
ncbi:hypothetical protein CHS19_000488 [Escherichia coli]|nr:MULTISPECIES: hypothetical protein [Enterobacteriaceae]EFA4051450.1 hypothetical protein [Escherichia coli O91:H28]EKD0895867.1 hypothetical protein [Shigella sonnei]EES4805021.1 hypothetical protein [Escherichia coli]EET2554817.1 hypothetical protein [Escherichia coli]EEU5544914.1 hypothetical protein [Escherichia coli]